MKMLYLIRHGKSSWKDEALSDQERPLNKRGKKDAPEMARWLLAKGIKPDLMLSSSAVRTKKTARKMAKELGMDKKEIVTTDSLYMADADEILQEIRQIDDRVDTAFVFGHNPGLTDLASQLASREIENVPTCGVVALKFEVNSWKEVSRKHGWLAFFNYPKNVA
jgi:phosphohistidine phosphatase